MVVTNSPSRYVPYRFSVEVCSLNILCVDVCYKFFVEVCSLQIFCKSMFVKYSL